MKQLIDLILRRKGFTRSAYVRRVVVPKSWIDTFISERYPEKMPEKYLKKDLSSKTNDR